jgi:hypothetical protein
MYTKIELPDAFEIYAFKKYADIFLFLCVLRMYVPRY